MDFKQIQDLIKLVNKSNISEIKVEEGEFKITIRTKEYAEGFRMKGEMPAPTQIAVPVQSISHPAPAGVPVETSTASPTTENGKSEKEEDAGSSDDSKYITIKSPMIGTFKCSGISPSRPPIDIRGLSQ